MPPLAGAASASEDADRERPRDEYAKTADGVHIAYQVVGDGPVDILFVLGWATHIEKMWTEPRFARFFTRLASFSRVMLFDKRGVGLSDYMRNAASPGAVNALSAMNRAIDVRSALPAIHVPTLVLARDDDLDYPMEETKWFAQRIRGARFVSFPGNEHLFVMGRQDDLLDEIERFVTEVRGEEADLDRVLATVLFTDIVGSTSKAAELGDKGWGALVEQHHGVVRALLGRFHGKEVDTAGDGFFATFDGPARGVRCATAISEAVSDLGIEAEPACIPGRSRRSPGRWAGSL